VKSPYQDRIDRLIERFDAYFAKEFGLTIPYDRDNIQIGQRRGFLTYDSLVQDPQFRADIYRLLPCNIFITEAFASEQKANQGVIGLMAEIEHTLPQVKNALPDGDGWFWDWRMKLSPQPTRALRSPLKRTTNGSQVWIADVSVESNIYLVIRRRADGTHKTFPPLP
jgi:hypothetical protein